MDNLFSWVLRPDAWLAFATLLLLEVVLGIDNVIFISILTAKVPPEQQPRTRVIGLLGAMVMRLLLLFSISWIYRLQSDLFTVLGNGFSGRDLILLLGGIFLIYKAVKEMHEQLEGPGAHGAAQGGDGAARATVGGIILQIMVLDLVFSLDSVITAVGMADDLGVMVSAVVVTVLIMLFAARPIGDFVQAHPTVKMLALAFLLLIGVNLIADGFGFKIPKGYTYFAMGFAILVELLNMKMRRGKAVPLHESPRHPDTP